MRKVISEVEAGTTLGAAGIVPRLAELAQPGGGLHGHRARDITMRLVVVGGGTAGMAAALQARELGADVTLLEASEVGGTTLNRGPAPVRTLARAARLARDWYS
jgi:NADPH-dependent 2,4-dienoyl-CoA reductase/sulfur reductase-like enzyme